MQAFLGNLPGLPKTALRFCREALYGVTTGQSLRLTDIARALNEDIPLIKTVNRLSRQADRPGMEWALTRHVIRQGAARLGPDALLIIDPSDLTKPYAEKMEYLGRVRDGSRKELANGYWLCQVVGVEPGGREITPLVNHLWSCQAPDFTSENDEVLRCVFEVARFTGDKGVWVMDRGGDRICIMDALLTWNRRFLLRLRGDRDLLWNGRKILASDLAARTPLPYIDHVVRQDPGGGETRLQLSYGMRKVRLPQWPDRDLRLVVVRGFGAQPLMLLTTEPLTDSRKSLWGAVESYLTRWRIEETLRFSKQTYALEDVRVLSYQRLKTLMAVALLAMYFAMAYLGAREKLAVLCRHALDAGRRLFGIPDFRYYALADGLAGILSKRIRPVFDNHKQPEDRKQQLDLFNWNSG